MAHDIRSCWRHMCRPASWPVERHVWWMVCFLFAQTVASLQPRPSSRWLGFMKIACAFMICSSSPFVQKNESRNNDVHHQCDRLAAGFQSKNCCDGAGFSGRTWCKDVYVVVQHGFTSLVSLVLVVIYPAWKIHFWTWPGPSVSGGHLLPGIGTTFFVAFLSVNSLRDRMIEHILNIMHSSFLAAILWASAMPGWGCGIRFSQKAWDNWRELNIRRTFLAALWIPERLSTLLRCREATIRTSDSTSWFQGGIPWFPHVSF